MEIPTETMTVQFSNLGIQCVKKKDIEQALKVREEIRVDPFRSKLMFVFSMIVFRSIVFFVIYFTV